MPPLFCAGGVRSKLQLHPDGAFHGASWLASAQASPKPFRALSFCTLPGINSIPASQSLINRMPTSHEPLPPLQGHAGGYNEQPDCAHLPRGASHGHSDTVSLRLPAHPYHGTPAPPTLCGSARSQSLPRLPRVAAAPPVTAYSLLGAASFCAILRCCSLPPRCSSLNAACPGCAPPSFHPAPSASHGGLPRPPIPSPGRGAAAQRAGPRLPCGAGTGMRPAASQRLLPVVRARTAGSIPVQSLPSAAWPWRCWGPRPGAPRALAPALSPRRSRWRAARLQQQLGRRLLHRWASALSRNDGDALLRQREKGLRV